MGGEGWRDRAWLERGLERIVEFSEPAPLAGGGFAWLDSDGSRMPRPPQLFLTARMTHVAAMGVARGIAGSQRLLDHGTASLLGVHRDVTHGGWFSEIGWDAGDPGAGAGDPAAPDDGPSHPESTALPTDPHQRKQAYDHVHVGLAAASAAAVGHPDAARLLALVTDVVDTHLWDELTGTLRESFAHDWSAPEPYRGANANMHGVEAMLAMGDATGESRWHARALRIAERIIDRGARAHGWLVPEHFDEHWGEDAAYNRDDPHHPFRPYGATPGHGLEWARFLLALEASPLLPPDTERRWLREAAIGLTQRALGTWGADAIDGLPYTVDWDGETVVSGLRLHWPLCEAIQACAALQHAGETSLGGIPIDEWLERSWRFASAHLIDERGTWRNELDADLREAGTVWPGRPDVYHCAGAYVVPTVPLTPFMTLALTRP